MTVKTAEQKAGLAVIRIIDNIVDRRGLGDEFAQIDEEIRAEIQQDWVRIIVDEHQMNTPVSENERLPPHPEREVFVIVGWYRDRSGCKLFGIYQLLRTAEDRKQLMEAAGSIYLLRVVKMLLDEACPQEVF